jgi:hypothetical protein
MKAKGRQSRILIWACIIALVRTGGAQAQALELASPRTGDVLHVTSRNQGFFDMAFDATQDLIAQGCAIHMLANGRRVAYWIPDPMLPAGALGVPGLWGLNGEWETFTKGRRKSVSVALPPGHYRAWVVQACAVAGAGYLMDQSHIGSNATTWNSFWAIWRESDCGDAKQKCERSQDVSFTVSRVPGAASAPRVELSFPGSLAVIKQGDPLLLQIALVGLLSKETRSFFDEQQVRIMIIIFT